jgi:acetyl esterase/lipase
VAIWVHGGGWAIGDKSQQMTDKITFFASEGYVLVSINYRLSPATPSLDPGQIMYPVHPQDVSLAVSWVIDHIADDGGDPKRIALLGHSAGAHLVALVSADQSFLQAQSKTQSALRCTSVLDTAALDLPTLLTDASITDKTLYINAFGSDPAQWALASPITHVAPAKSIPTQLIIKRGEPIRQQIVASYAAALTQAGVSATVVDASALTHAEVNSAVGKAGDVIVTPPITTFLKACFK